MIKVFQVFFFYHKLYWMLLSSRHTYDLTGDNREPPQNPRQSRSRSERRPLEPKALKTEGLS